MQAKGFAPFVIVFLDERGRIEVLADPEIDDLAGFLRCHAWELRAATRRADSK
jgi:hypothetical protein